MTVKERQALGSLGFGLLLVGLGLLNVLGYIDLGPHSVSYFVGFGAISIGAGGVVAGFDFLFRPGEPSTREVSLWNRLRIVGAVFFLLGVALTFGAIFRILVQ